MDIRSWVVGLPKAELHIHLEGAVKPETLIKLSNKYGLDLPKSVEGLKKLYEFENFAKFLDVYLLISKCLMEKDDLKLVARDHLEHAARQGILYSEVEFTPNTILKNGLSYKDQVDGIIEGIRDGEDKYGVTMRLIPDVIPGEGVGPAMRLLDEIENNPRPDVIAFGIGGPERDYLINDFKPVYERARRLGLKATAHAGETAGPESMWEAINGLKVNRIGHGTRLTEDKKLVECLKNNKVSLDVCPTSNLKIKGVKDYKSHPIRFFFDSGISLSISSDDPGIFCHDLVDEYLVLYKEGIFSVSELKELAVASFNNSFLPETEKKEYLAKLDNYSMRP